MWFNFENIIKSSINYILSIIALFYSLIWGLSYDKPYEKDMECSDIVSNSNYNIMIEKIQKNGNKIEFCFYLQLLFLFLNIFSFIVFIIECSCDDYCNEKCESCCCICCRNNKKGDKDLLAQKKEELSKIEISTESKIQEKKSNENSTNHKKEESSKDNILKNNDKLFKNKVW